MKLQYLLVTFIFSGVNCQINNVLNLPSFFEGMDCDNTFQPNFCSAQHWLFSKENYENYRKNFTYHKEPLIPKIIHQIWIGSPLPQHCKMFQETWKKLHPDWKYVLWSDQDIRNLGLKNMNLYNKASNYGEKSDIARYEILYKFGGLYIDTDFKGLQSFDFLHHTCSFYAGFLYSRKPSIYEIANGLMGSAPGHPVLKQCIETMKRTNNDNSPMAIINRTGPLHLTKCYKELLLNNNLPDFSIILPTNFLYAFPGWKRAEKNPEIINSWLKNYSLAIHYWHCSWQKKGFDTPQEKDFEFFENFGSMN